MAACWRADPLQQNGVTVRHKNERDRRGGHPAGGMSVEGLRDKIKPAVKVTSKNPGIIPTRDLPVIKNSSAN